MSPLRAATVLWFVLMLMTPMPIFHGGWGRLPPWQLTRLAWLGEGWMVQALLGIAACLGAALGYYFFSARLPLRIRGALVGLLGLVALVVFSAVPVYLWPDSGKTNTFAELYHQPLP